MDRDRAYRGDLWGARRIAGCLRFLSTACSLSKELRSWKTPPQWKAQRHGPGVKLLSPVLVLACGPTGFLRTGPLEIIGYATSNGLCIGDEVRYKSLFGGSCEQSGTSWHEFWPGPIHLESDGWARGEAEPTASYLSGVIEPTVTEVEVRFNREEKIFTKRATVAHVDGEVLSNLHQSEPFARFAAVLPGCVPPRAVRVIARNSEGEVLGSDRGWPQLGIAHFCHPRLR
jgi:hypothetical protein